MGQEPEQLAGDRRGEQLRACEMILPYPGELEGSIRLPNQLRLRIRPLRRCDDLPIRELYDHLSPRTRYLRFFLPMPALPEPLLNCLACTDYHRRLALLAEASTVDGHIVVGLGNYGATEDGTVEVGLVVRDKWQKQGIGTALATKLLQAAEARGFNRFVANVLWENVAARRLLKHVAVVVSTKTQHGVSEVSFVLSTASPRNVDIPEALV